ncbi:hypothetical protein LTR62_006792 [Meristemomyces frigidus]|uniref:Alpha N-terminal protein methyltransferase 1 n=1 Tax=Meristemomyces frigidus TaxID=1508187 RepID=A0AAN7TN31_9PEZI|nr:hypothetical protein LTR62_006792 [Meristemomyces frigidus]
MPSPKRKSEAGTDNEAKKQRTTTATATMTAPTPDSHIDPELAIKYWSSTEASVNGVLGGFPQVSRIDLQGSSNFLAKLRKQSPHTHLQPKQGKLKSAVDCGAGIGRITEGLLSSIAETVDVVEPVQAFTDVIKGKAGVGEIYNVGLENWFPAREGLGPYDLIWNQWCVGQLTDAQLVAYLARLPAVLSQGGWIVVKENLSNNHDGQDVYDETDSSVTRTDDKFRRLFGEAGLRVVSTEVQRGMPKDLYPVRAYALQPK